MFKDIVEWASTEYFHDSNSKKQGNYDPTYTPYLNAILRNYQDELIRVIVIMAPAQWGKTVLGLIVLVWGRANKSKPFMWVLPASDEAQTFFETRVLDVLQKCPTTARLLPANPNKIKVNEIQFPHSNMLLVGAGGTGSKLSGKSIGDMYMDERKNFKAGQWEKGAKRVRAHEDYKLTDISTPTIEGQGIHAHYLEGDQNHWHIPCPKCGKSAPLRIRESADVWNLQWNNDAPTWSELVESIKYVCPHCREHAWRDCEKDRNYLLHEGLWVPHNPSAPYYHKSYRGPALLPPWTRWEELIKSFLSAKAQLQQGLIEPLQVCINEDFGETWKDHTASEPADLDAADYDAKDYARETLAEPVKLVPNEVARYMTIDRQRGKQSAGDYPHRWVCIRAWLAGGASRLLYFGRVDTKEGCRALQALYGVQDKRVFQDMQYETDKVFEECAEYGWIGLGGHGDQNFRGFPKIVDLGNGRKEKRMYWYSQVQHQVVQGQKINYVLYVSDKIADVLQRLVNGVGATWEVGRGFPEDYLKQLNGDVKVEEMDKKTGQMRNYYKKVGDNHSRDCEKMQVAAAMMFKVLALQYDTEKEPKPKPTATEE